MEKLYKNKNFYMALGVGVICMLGLVYSFNNRATREKLANINKARNTLENDIDNKISSNYVIENATIKPKSKDDIQSKKETKEKTTVNVVANKSKKKKNIGKFDQEKGLIWPVSGEIIKEYCVDKLVYFPTLKVYKANPAIFIKSHEGDNVRSASKGVVTKVGKDTELGNYLEVDIGSNYKLVYGQLKGIAVSNGDRIKEGQVIAQIARPTSYYTKEGSHLFFQVKEDNIEINPLLFLK